jgi:hypothetical protein
MSAASTDQVAFVNGRTRLYGIVGDPIVQVRSPEMVTWELQRRGLDAVLVPSSDPHLSEYLPERWQGRQWLSGFTGSMGTLVVTRDDAAVFADSRLFHWNREAFDRDAAQRTQLASLGWTVVIVTKAMLTKDVWLTELRRCLERHAPQRPLFLLATR